MPRYRSVCHFIVQRTFNERHVNVQQTLVRRLPADPEADLSPRLERHGERIYGTVDIDGRSVAPNRMSSRALCSALHPGKFVLTDGGSSGRVDTPLGCYPQPTLRYTSDFWPPAGRFLEPAVRDAE